MNDDTGTEALNAQQGNTPALDALTAQHRKFVVAYLQHFNGTKAAIEAGYGRNKARNQAWRLRTNEDIAAAIDEGVANYGLSKPTVLQRFAEVFIGADLAEFEPYIEGEASLRDLRAKGVNTRILKGVRTRRRTQTYKDGSTVVTETRNVELNDPMKAGSEIARLLGYVIERHAHSADMGWLKALEEMSDEQLLRDAEAAGMLDGDEARKLIAMSPPPADGNGGGNGGGK